MRDKWLQFSTRDREVIGRVVSDTTEANGYRTVEIDVDGLIYAFGTGGHLGRTWTTDDGSQQWFMAEVR